MANAAPPLGTTSGCIRITINGRVNDSAENKDMKSQPKMRMVTTNPVILGCILMHVHTLMLGLVTLTNSCHGPRRALLIWAYFTDRFRVLPGFIALNGPCLDFPLRKAHEACWSVTSFIAEFALILCCNQRCAVTACDWAFVFPSGRLTRGCFHDTGKNERIFGHVARGDLEPECLIRSLKLTHGIV